MKYEGATYYLASQSNPDRYLKNPRHFLPETDVPSGDLAVLVWVTEAGRQAPIQSAGGYLHFTS